MMMILYFCSWQWDSIENKTSVAIYGGGALLALWLSSTIVSAVNSVPLVSYMYLDSYGDTQYICVPKHVRVFIYPLVHVYLHRSMHLLKT